MSLLIAAGCGGDPGADGADGAPGEQGLQGLPGDDGAPGPQGGSGAQGADGAQGDTGPQGDTGADGAQGDVGDQGDQGPQGDVGAGLSGPFTGIVTGPNGPVEGANVALFLRALDGTDMGLLAATVTAADGSYSMLVGNISAASSTLVLRASTEDGMLSAITSDTDTDVSVASTAITNYVDAVVGGGSTLLTEFTGGEIAALVTSADAALVADSTDLTDEQAVADTVAAALEVDLAAAASASFSIGFPPNPVSVEPADVRTDIASFSVDLNDAAGELWDIFADGSIGDGTNDSYDTMFSLSIDGNGFPSQTELTAEAQLEDGREVALGPVVDMGGTGLTVTRKIHVSDTLGYARFLEILSNPGGTDITVPVLISGNLGSDESNDVVFESSSGDITLDSSDRWFTNHQDSSDPAVGFLFPGAVPSKSSDDIFYEWASVTVPAGETVSLIHWGFQQTNGSPSAVQELTAHISGLPEVPPAEYWEGVTSAEAASTQLMGLRLLGSSGVVAPNSTVTVTVNPDGLGGFDSQFTSVSASDGSVSATLPAGVSTLEVTTANGTDALISLLP